MNTTRGRTASTNYTRNWGNSRLPLEPTQATANIKPIRAKLHHYQAILLYPLPRNKPPPAQPTKLLSCTVARSRKGRVKNTCLFWSQSGMAFNSGFAMLIKTGMNHARNPTIRTPIVIATAQSFLDIRVSRMNCSVVPVGLLNALIIEWYHVARRVPVGSTRLRTRRRLSSSRQPAEFCTAAQIPCSSLTSPRRRPISQSLSTTACFNICSSYPWNSLGSALRGTPSADRGRLV